MKIKKGVWISAVIIAIVATGTAVYTLSPDKSKQQDEVTVKTTAVQKGDISVIVKGSGSVKATHSETVFAKDQGNVARVLVNTNTRIKKGQVLMTYKATNVDTSLRQQLNTLRQNQNALQDKQDQYKKLVMDGAAQGEVDTAKLAIERSKEDITATEAEIAALHKDQAPHAPLAAPMDGTVTKISVSSGGAVMSGAEAFKITDYKNLSATIRVDELDIPKIALGMAATVKLDALANKLYSGKVVAIADEGKVTNGVSLFDVTIRLTDPSAVKAGMSAQGTIQIEEKKGILVLPIESVTQRGDKYFVQVLDTTAKTTSPDMTPVPEEKEVKVGVHDESQIEITSGLKLGDQVVIPTVIAPSGASPASQDQGFFGGGGEDSGNGGDAPAGGGGL
ncbi:efflux RND transporter periplasmic adaptor subunit [Paenibacillus sp. HW567]|uniref:efflux RND transporter periplasmic adaptor subunit n=1 Tax=Paenibacillus sp. HW567 TaxID=1034769 RepID=UPI000379F02D|nr:efflux RND transporter periplasmic adaptor subunit [Paenibacillus sp. HW567]